MRVHILKQANQWQPGPPRQVGYGIFDPVHFNLRELADRGVEIHFFDESHLPDGGVADCDVLIVNSWAFFNAFGDPDGKDGALAALERLSDGIGKLIWFDARDSAGTTQFSVMPYVDMYLKKQLYRDRSVYAGISKLRESRLYTEFYSRLLQHPSPRDLSEDQLAQVDLQPEHLDKLAVGWNIGLEGIAHWAARSSAAHPYDVTFVHGGERPYSLFAAMSTRYASIAIAAQRRQCMVLVGKLDLPGIVTGRMPVDRYFATLRKSVAALSPFGWGEICYRDFESVLCGAALFKPDMECIETWPDIYRANETYVPFKWDFSDFGDQARRACDPGEAATVSRRASQIYRDALSCNGMSAFCDRFCALLAQAATPGRHETLQG
jgi:hypothetical protein